uniref:Uncharacterized protein n=1 Tax=Phytophthora ramorum TaxID=164328 RepID=H3GQV6_PHYRM
MARKHARGEEMPAEPKRRRPRCDAASQDNDTARLTRVLDFNGVWKEMKAAGWTHKLPRGLDNRYRYVLPGRSANGKDGEDFLLGEEAVLRYFIQHSASSGGDGGAATATAGRQQAVGGARGLGDGDGGCGGTGDDGGDRGPGDNGVCRMAASHYSRAKQLLTRKGFATMVAALWQRDLSVVPAVVFEFVGVGVGAVVVLAADAEAVAEIELSGA